MPFEMNKGDSVHEEEAHAVGYKDGETVEEILNETLYREVLEAITVTDGGGVNITWSAGEIYTADGDIIETDAEATPQACTDHAINYLYYDHSGGGTALTLSTTAPNMTQDIPVATINVADGDIHDLHHTPIYTEATPALVVVLGEIFPSIITSGLIVSEHAGAAAFDVDMSVGVYYHAAVDREPVAAQDSTVDNLTRWYQSAAGAWTHVAAQTIIDTGFWNTGNDIATAVNAAKYYRSLFFVDSDGINWVYPTAEYNTVAQAIAGADPVLPAGLTDHPKSTVVILRGNDAAFPTAGGERWIDVRPILGGGISGDFSDHVNLASIGTVTHAELDAHKDRHDPNDGADPLDTANAAEISVVVAAGTGTSHSLARADHVHAINHAITDNHIVTVDGTANAAEYAKFTANGLEGKTFAEMITDLTAAAIAWRTRDLPLHITHPQVDDEYLLGFVSNAAHFVEVHGACLAATSCSIQIERRVKATPFTTGTDILSAALAIDVGAETTAAFVASGVVTADQWLYVRVTAVVGTPTEVDLCAEITID